MSSADQNTVEAEEISMQAMHQQVFINMASVVENMCLQWYTLYSRPFI